MVISFHSLEDRIVKQFIARHSREVFDRRAPFAAPKAMKLKALERVKPTAAEIAANPAFAQRHHARGREDAAMRRLQVRRSLPAGAAP